MTKNLKKMYDEHKKFIKKDTNAIIKDIKAGKVTLDTLIKEYAKSKDKENFDLSAFWEPKYIWAITMGDLSKLDLRNVSVEELMRLSFSTETKWPPKDKLPKGFDPEKIIEKAKSFKGSGVEELHEKNIKGKGIKIAYIDKPFDVNHQEFKGANIEYINFDSRNEFDFHGYAVASRVVGQNLGMAPKADFLYYACGFNEKYENYFEGYTANYLKAVNDIIKRAKNGEKIDAIGVSGSIPFLIQRLPNKELSAKFQEKWKSLSAELKELEIPVIDSITLDKSDFSFAFKVDPLKSNEDLNNCQSFCLRENTISVLEADKCIPMPYTENGYKYENVVGCASWSIPQVVSMYALAKEKNINLTFKEFVEVAHSTSKTNENGTKFLDADEIIKELEYRKENELTLKFE